MAKSARVEALPNMKPYFYRGKFTPALISTVCNDPDAFNRTMRASVQAFGGALLNCRLEAFGADPIGFLEFPTDIAARSWNTFYASRKGVLESKISRLLDDEDLKDMKKLVQASKRAPTARR